MDITQILLTLTTNITMEQRKNTSHELVASDKHRQLANAAARLGSNCMLQTTPSRRIPLAICYTYSPNCHGPWQLGM